MPRRRIIKTQIPKPSEETTTNGEGSVPDKKEPQATAGSTTAEASQSEPLTAPLEPLSQLSTPRRRTRTSAVAPEAEEENSLSSKTMKPKEVVTESMRKTPDIQPSRVSRRTLSPHKRDIEVASQEDEKNNETPAAEVKEIVTEVKEAVRGRRKRGRPRTQFVSKVVENNEDIDATSRLENVEAEEAQVETVANDSSQNIKEIDPLQDVKEGEDSNIKGAKRPRILKRRHLWKSPESEKSEPNFETKDSSELKIDKDVELNKKLPVSNTLDIKEESRKEICATQKEEVIEKVSVAEVKVSVSGNGEEKMKCDFQEKKDLCISAIGIKGSPGANNALSAGFDNGVEVNEEAPSPSRQNLNDSPARGRRILRSGAGKENFETPERKNTVNVADDVQSCRTEIAKGTPSRTGKGGKGLTKIEGKQTSIHSPEIEVSIKEEPILPKTENIECDEKLGTMKKSAVIKLAVEEPIEVPICNNLEKIHTDDTVESPPTNKVEEGVSVTPGCKDDAKKEAEDMCDISDKVNFNEFIEVDDTGNFDETENEEDVPDDEKDHCSIIGDEELDYDIPDENIDDDVSSLDANELLIIEDDTDYKSFYDEEIKDVEEAVAQNKQAKVKDQEKEKKEDYDERRKDSHQSSRKSPESRDRQQTSRNRRKSSDSRSGNSSPESRSSWKSPEIRDKRRSPDSKGEKRSQDSKEESKISQENKSRSGLLESKRKNEGQDKKDDSQCKSDQKRNKSPSKADGKEDHAAGNRQQIHTKKNRRGKSFRQVVILANSLYRFQLEGMESTYIKVIYEDNLSSEKLVHIIQKYSIEYGSDTMWILAAGVFTFMNSETEVSCKDCQDPLRSVHAKPTQTSKKLLTYILHLGSLTCDSVQYRLGSEGLITIVPPLPVLLAITENYKTHEELHEAAEGHGLIATKLTYETVWKRYDVFCREWTNKACDRNKSWIDVAAFREYKVSGESNMFSMLSKDRYEVRMKEWFEVMKKFINLVLETPAPSGRILGKVLSSHKRVLREEPPANEPETEKFTKVVVIRNTPFTKHLQSLTKDLNVEYLNDNIDFDEEGLAFLNGLQKKHPRTTLYVVLSGVSEIAELVESGPPKCQILNCDDPVPAFVPKNDSAGDSDFKDMNIDQMVNIKVKEAFSFATLAIDKLREGSGIFLAPIMPLCAIWSGNATMHSHDAIHRMFKRDPIIPHFSGLASTWIRSAKALEVKWLDKIMSSLEKDSYSYELMKNYREERPPVLEYVEDVTVPKVKQVQKTWSKMMAKMLEFCLVVNEPKAVLEPVPTPVTLHNLETNLVPPGVSCTEADLPSTHQAPSAYPHGVAPVGYTYPEAGLSMNPQFSSLGAQALTLAVAAAYQGTLAYSGHTQQGMPFQGAAYQGAAYQGAAYQGAAYQGAGYQGFQAATSQDPYYRSWTTPTTPVNPTIAAASTFVPSISVAPVSETSAAAVAGTCTIQAPPKLKTGMKGHLVIENVKTDMNESQARLLLQTFGELGEMKWPLNQKGRSARFLMIHYNQRKHAERAERILNYLKVFGNNSQVKLIGGDKKEGGTKLENEDLELLLGVHDILDKIKKENKKKKVQQTPWSQLAQSKAKPVVPATVGPLQVPATVGPLQVPATVGPLQVPATVGPLQVPATVGSLQVPATVGPCQLPATVGPLQLPATVGPLQAPTTSVLTIIVSNFTDIVPVKDVNEMFVELGACDQGVLIKNALHFTFKGEPAVINLLSGFRFPDKKMEVTVKAATNKPVLTNKALNEAKARMEKPLSKLLKKITNVLKEEIDEELNVYGFKTRLCRYADVCKAKDLCPKFHDARDRRRCPILYRYSDEMCTDLEETDSCNAKDKCSSAHSPVEILFHFKNFRSSICPGWQQNRACDKVGRVCSYVHPGKPEMLYNEKWNNVYVGGLKRTLDYLTEAVRNLFLIKDLQCLRVLLVTTSPEMAKLYVDCISDLAKSCNQKVSLLAGETIKQGTTVLITTVDALRPLLLANKQHQPKKLDSSRLKALILDDGPAVLKHCPKYMQTYFADLARKDANVVVTAEKVVNDDVEVAQNKIRPRGGFQKIFPVSSTNKDSKHPPSAKSGSYRNDVLERLISSKGPADTNHKQKKASERWSSQDRTEKVSANRSYSKERTSARDSSRGSSSRSSTSKDSSSSNQKLDDRVKTLATLQIKYKTTLAELEKEQEQQRELYISSPEFHPEYEPKYSIFMEQYKVQYPKWINIEHFNKLWEDFWKEHITLLLQEEYDAKKQTLEKEYSEKKERVIMSTPILDCMNNENKQDEDRQERRPNESQKRTFSTDDRDSHREKYRRDEDGGRRKTHQHNRNEDSDEGRRLQYSRNEELSWENSSRFGRFQQNSNKEELSTDRRQESNSPMDNTEENYDIGEVLTLLEELCPSLGVWGPAAQILMRKLALCGSDMQELSQLVQDEDNKMILHRLSEKALGVSEMYGSGAQAMKLRFASSHALKLSNMASLPSGNNKYFGLDIENIATLTYNIEPSYIIQCIRNALNTKGIINASEKDITDIYEAVTTAHFGIAYNKLHQK